MSKQLPALPDFYPGQAFTWAALVPQHKQIIDVQLARIEDALHIIQENQAALVRALLAQKGGEA